MPLTVLPEQSISDVFSLFTLKFGTEARVTALADGRMVVVWTEPVGDKSIHVRLFDADGAPLGASTIANPTSANTHGDPQVTALADGGFLVSWQMAILNGEDNIFVRAYDAAGAPRSDALMVSPDGGNVDSTADDDQYAEVLGLAGGGAIIAWEARGPNDTFARVLGADGVTLGDPVQIFTSGEDVRLLQLANGDVLIADEPFSGTGTTIRLSAADLVGAPAGVPGATGPVVIDIDQTPDEHGAVSGLAFDFIQALATGGFVMGYRYDPDIRFDDPIDFFRIDWYDDAGVLQNSVDVTIPGTPESAEFDLGQVVALDDGRFVVIWQIAIAYRDFDLKAQLFNADGTADGEPIQLTASTTGTQVLYEATVLADGNVAVVFADGSNLAVEGGIDPLHLVVIDVPASTAPVGPTPGDDVLDGTPGNDTIIALAGNDSIDGLDGNDLLQDDAGNDTMRGSAGDDTFVAGAGDDIYDGGTGTDEVRFISTSVQQLTVNLANSAAQNTLVFGTDTFIGIENVFVEVAGGGRIIGTPGANVMTGTSAHAYDERFFGLGGDDSIETGEGSDFANGGNGNDTLVGGSDRDRLFGGADDDLIRGEGGSDLLVGGAGSDEIWSGSGVDVLVGGDHGPGFPGDGEADVFVFDDGFSGTGAARDVIRDFEAGLDIIDLTRVDADVSTAGDDALSFIGAARFSGAAGELRVVTINANTLVQLDTDGDGTSDMDLLISGTQPLSASDFLL